ncbi:hypothetical protein EJ110_NYTH17677 [Nymphaea thermarum]|nr:hypothetical protein EJ110_NYTH17677 [Nymphaea thermarum]
MAALCSSTRNNGIWRVNKPRKCTSIMLVCVDMAVAVGACESLNVEQIAQCMLLDAYGPLLSLVQSKAAPELMVFMEIALFTLICSSGHPTQLFQEEITLFIVTAISSRYARVRVPSAGIFFEEDSDFTPNFGAADSSPSSDEGITTLKHKPREENQERSERKNEKKREEREEAPPQENKAPENESLHSMQDPNKPDLLRTFGRINGKKVLILLDNGATKNFLTEEAAEKCNVPYESSSPHTIIVGGGGRLKCTNMGKDVEMVVSKRPFTIDVLVIPLDGVDLILGMPWFFTLGIITWDPKNFSMTFIPDGDTEQMTVKGINRHACPKAALRALDTEQPACWADAVGLHVDSEIPAMESLPFDYYYSQLHGLQSMEKS